MPTWKQLKELFFKKRNKNDMDHEIPGESTNNVKNTVKETPVVQQDVQSTYSLLCYTCSSSTHISKSQTTIIDEIENGNLVDPLNMPYLDGAGPSLSILPDIVSRLNLIEEDYTKDDPEIIGILKNCYVDLEISTRRLQSLTFSEISNGFTNAVDCPKTRPATPSAPLAEMDTDDELKSESKTETTSIGSSWISSVYSIV